MRRPPPLDTLPRYPLTAGVGLAAIAITLAGWARVNLEPLYMNERAFEGQTWRLVTSALPHGNLFHLAFNLYWLWVFGTLVEATFGLWPTAGIMLLFAVGSSAAEYA